MSQTEADGIRTALDIAAQALGVPPETYDDEKTTLEYFAKYGEMHMAKAMRWKELVNLGLTKDSAKQQTQQEHLGIFC